MKVVTCTGYYYSGSSAVTDLIAEYSTVKPLGDFEFRFLHDIDGVSDLEFHLVECHNRHNSGHALKRFLRLAHFNAGSKLRPRYEKFFNNQYLKLTKKYVSDLSDLQYKGWWFFDLYDKGFFTYYLTQALNHFFRKFHSHIDLMNKEMTFCSHPTIDKFLHCTREYTESLLSCANVDNYPILEIDQLVPSQNINRILRYLPDQTYVFVVDRDPRDVYIEVQLTKEAKVCPRNVNDFCKWYNYTRASGVSEQLNSEIVKSLHFEDLIYRYEETKKDVEQFLGLSSFNMEKEFTFFNPKYSVKNTQMWKKYPSFSKDIKIIEEQCSSYLFDFDSIQQNEIMGI